MYECMKCNCHGRKLNLLRVIMKWKVRPGSGSRLTPDRLVKLSLGNA